MDEALKTFTDSVRADERQRIAKDAAKLLKHRDALRVALENFASAVTLLVHGTGTDLVEQVAQPRKAPSPKLSADEKATLVLAVVNSHTPRTIKEISEIAHINVGLVGDGLKLLQKQRRVVCVNQEARRNRRYQLVKEDNHDGLSPSSK